MIEFNKKDFQLDVVGRESKLFNLQTKNAFRVYGLRTKGNPLVHLSYNYDMVDDAFDAEMEKLIAFFQNNGIEFQWESGGGTAKVCIGLRRDLRDHTVLCCSILQTIIYSLEGRLNLKTNFKIKGIPKFPTAKNAK